MAVQPLLHFVHTELFEETAAEIPVTEDELRALQETLRADPEAGDMIPGTGGIRKIRLGVKGKGKRGGSRVIYYYVARRETVYLLMAYDKSVADDLSAAGRKLLRRLARELQDEEEGS